MKTAPTAIVLLLSLMATARAEGVFSVASLKVMCLSSNPNTSMLCNAYIRGVA
jgi:hypothetical protein